MKKLKKAIIILVVIILLCVILLLFFNMKEKKQEEELKFADPDTEIEKNTPNSNVSKTLEVKFHEVDNKDRFFTVKNLLEKLFSGISYTSIEESSEILRDILGNEYLQENNLTNEQLINRYSSYAGKSLYINNMYVSEKSDFISIYLVEVTVDNSESDEFMVVLNSNNLTYSIFPKEYIEKHGYNINMSEEAIQEFEITENTYNKFSFESVTQEDMAKNYFYDYKRNLIYNIESAYNSLDEEYREKRFGSLEEYINVVNKNLTELKNIRLEKYLVNTYTDYTEYVCKDQNENLYIFRDYSVMKYSLLLDNYTILTDNFKEQYQNVNDIGKVQMNIERFVQMLNNYDYTTAYEYLDENFKNRYFKTVEDFENYIKTNYYQYNNISFDQYANESNIYTYKIFLNNKLDGNSEWKEMNINMKLEEDTEFVMSFEVI